MVEKKKGILKLYTPRASHESDQGGSVDIKVSRGMKAQR